MSQRGPRSGSRSGVALPEAEVCQRTQDGLEVLPRSLVCLGACPDLPFPNKSPDGQEEHLWGNYQFN